VGQCLFREGAKKKGGRARPTGSCGTLPHVRRPRQRRMRPFEEVDNGGEKLEVRQRGAVARGKRGPSSIYSGCRGKEGATTGPMLRPKNGSRGGTRGPENKGEKNREGGQAFDSQRFFR